MPQTAYQYSIGTDMPNGVVIPSLVDDIAASAIVVALDSITRNGDTLTLTFKDALGASDKTLLDGDTSAPAGGVLGAHTATPVVPPPQKVQPTVADYGGSSHWRGASFVATAGQTTAHDEAVGVESKLFGGTYFADDNAVVGDDWISFQVVDVDGIMSPPGTVLKEYVSEVPIVPGERRTLRSGQAAIVLAGLYLRTVYKSTGASNVKVLIDWLVFE